MINRRLKRINLNRSNKPNNRIRSNKQINYNRNNKPNNQHKIYKRLKNNNRTIINTRHNKRLNLTMANRSEMSLKSKINFINKANNKWMKLMNNFKKFKTSLKHFPSRLLEKMTRKL